MPQFDTTTVDRLVALGQGHLFEGKTDDQIASLMAEINTLSYNGGIERYIAKGRTLLSGAVEVEADKTIVRVELPDERLLVDVKDMADVADAQLLEDVKDGIEAMRDNVFVMVAGGLGERLGFHSIKLGLPVETATNTSYIELYLRWAAACGRNPNWKPSDSSSPSFSSSNNNSSPKQNPFLIMTSEDTHQLTVEHLEANNYFGYDPTSVILMKQDTVPCLSDNTAKIALGKDGKLLRKPHGHGDVHQLIYALPASSANASSSSSSSANDDGNSKTAAAPLLLIDELLTAHGANKAEAPYRSITFMQDTNAAATSTAPLSVHYLHKNDWAMAFTSVPRMPGEAIGIFCSQTMGSGAQRCGNIEYNMFNPIYTSCSGHANEPLVDGKYSVFPGSINTLIMSLEAYAAALHKDKGHVPEFINPKFADSTKTVFKSPARIESLMQDIAFCFDFPRQKIGCTTFSRGSFEPVKNALADGIAGAVEKGIMAACAASGEEAWLNMNRTRVANVGVKIGGEVDAPVTTVVSPADPTKSITVKLFPIVTYDSAFINFNIVDTVARFPNPTSVSISSKSTLIVKGNVIIKSLKLDGALIIDATSANGNVSSSPFVVENLAVSNAGWSAVPVGELSAEATAKLEEVDTIRGYVYDRKETAQYVFNANGEAALSSSN